MTAIQGDTELKHSHRAMWASGDYPRMVTTFPTPLGGTDGRARFEHEYVLTVATRSP